MSKGEAEPGPGKDWILDPRTFLSMQRAARRRTLLHDKMLQEILLFIYQRFSKTVAYDHITSTIPKAKISLYHLGRFYDIAFIYGERIYYLQLDSRKFKPWRKGEGELNGESQEPY